MRRSTTTTLSAALGCACLCLASSCATPTNPREAASLLDRIDAGRIVAIGDGDFLASTYADQRLASADAPLRDTLTVWRPRRGAAAAATSVDAPNSVTSPPEALVLSPDGNTAYVIERLGQRAPGLTTIAQLPRGGRLTAIDLRDPAQPRRTAMLDLGDSPEALDLRGDGRLLAVVSNSATASRVQLVEVDGPRLGAVHAFDLADHGVVGRGDGARGGVTASAVAWQPRGDALAVSLNTRDEVAFLRVGGEARAPTLQAWGAPVRVGRDPFTGRFTPDGRHYLALEWGRDLAARTLEGRLPDMPSRISVVRLASSSDDADAAHAVIGTAATDRSSEGIAISPDGRLVATVNMRETALPPQAPRHVREATVSLLAFDPRRGALTRLGETPFVGVLPEGASFDRSGRHLLVSVFAYRDAPGGGIEVFKVNGGSDRDVSSAALTHLGRIAAPHGTHHVVVGR